MQNFVAVTKDGKEVFVNLIFVIIIVSMVFALLCLVNPSVIVIKPNSAAIAVNCTRYKFSSIILYALLSLFYANSNENTMQAFWRIDILRKR